MFTITVNGREIAANAGESVRAAALRSGIYIPGLCDHPDLDAFRAFHWSQAVWQGSAKFVGRDNLPPEAGGDAYPHCELCLVSADGGRPRRSCDLRVAEGMDVITDNAEIVALRRGSLSDILATHPHACLTCAQRHGCDRLQCSMNVPVSERCCELLGRCEIGKVADFIGIAPDTPTYRNRGRTLVQDEPLYIRDYELCIGCTRCVRVCRDVRGVDSLGAVGAPDGLIIGTNAGPTLMESFCRFCGACVEVCPTGALRDKPGLMPLIDDMAPCTAGCPLHIDVPGYLDLIAAARDGEALELIRERAALPGVLGYACFHPCELNCRRAALDDPASICVLKRFVSDTVGLQPELSKAPATGKRVAVIGGGPAGLAAAADLLRMGHQVTVFERASDLGGMLRHAIPSFRLPAEVVDRDLKYLFGLGLEVKLNQDVTAAEDIDALFGQGFKAVLVAVGLRMAAKLGVNGEDLTRVLPCLDFLNLASQGKAPELYGKVIVIGGGSVAVDAAMTALRRGAKEALMVCLEAKGELPAHPDELAFASEEGVQIEGGWGVREFIGSGGGLSSIVLKRCHRVFDERGRFNPQFDDDATRELEADWAIVAIGQRRGEEADALMRSRPGVYFAGDALTGPATIVAAMADGRRAARELDRFLGGSGEPPVRPIPRHSGWIGREAGFTHERRHTPARLDAQERLASGAVILSGLSVQDARLEAGRCLRCQLRAQIAAVPLPPEVWRELTAQTLAEIPAAPGVIVLADDLKHTTRIAGAADLKAELQRILAESPSASYCRWEEDAMYTKRESELIQAHIQEFGEMPGAGDLDDLF